VKRKGYLGLKSKLSSVFASSSDASSVSFSDSAYPILSFTRTFVLVQKRLLSTVVLLLGVTSRWDVSTGTTPARKLPLLLQAFDSSSGGNRVDLRGVLNRADGPTQIFSRPADVTLLLPEQTLPSVPSLDMETLDNELYSDIYRESERHDTRSPGHQFGSRDIGRR
jgi:hypothetical protein